MIYFNENDFHLTEIKRESKLFNLITDSRYKIFGLKQSNNPIIDIEYSNDTRDIIDNKRSEIQKFFEIANLKDIEFEYKNVYNNEIKIGLRKDLRKHIILTAAILRTIVYCLEGKLDLKKNYKLPGFPKFD